MCFASFWLDDALECKESTHTPLGAGCDAISSWSRPPKKKKILSIRKINGCRAVSTNHILSWVCSNISLIIPKQKLIFGKAEENILQWKATKMNCPNTYVFYLSDFMGKRGQSYTFFEFQLTNHTEKMISSKAIGIKKRF